MKINDLRNDSEYLGKAGGTDAFCDHLLVHVDPVAGTGPLIGSYRVSRPRRHAGGFCTDTNTEFDLARTAPPALDVAFNTADLPMMLRVDDVSPRYRQHFFGAEA
jgi:putative hemolysin